MALFDAVARTAEVPVYSLLGRKVHAKTPLSWWNIDMPPEDMAAECREALRTGYLPHKTKGRHPSHGQEAADAYVQSMDSHSEFRPEDAPIDP